MQALWGMREKVSVLVNRAALDRRAVDDEELGSPQPALDEIVEDSAPGLGALATHALDREQHLLAVRAHAEDNEQRDGGRFAVEPHTNDGAVEDALHLAPRPAHRVLADRSAEQGRQRAPHPPRIGAGEIRAGDQRVGREGAPLIRPQRLALPFRRPALGRGQPGARHRDLDRPERACQRPRPAAVAVARNARSSFVAGYLASPVRRPCQRSIELAAEQLFNELARSSPHLGLDRIEPIVEKINSHFGRRLQRIRLRGIARHGVVSSPTLQRRMIRG